MKEKSIFKKRLKILLLILVIILMVNLIKYMLEKNDGYIQKIDIPVVQESSMSIIGSSSEKIDIENLDIIVLYDTVWVPINDTFKAIFGERYVENENQTLKQGSMALNIDFDSNEIIIPKTTKVSGEKMDNTIVVEIEEYENKKYIPLYLVSNINNIIVKLDNKEVYKSDNYISSIDVIKEKNDNHSIEIYMITQNENKNETYIGQSLGSLWREEALKRIEKYRKNDFNIVVKNQNNRTYDSINTKITMTNNEFKFGTAIWYYEKGQYNSYSKIDRKIFNMLGGENSFKWRIIDQYGYNRALDVISNAVNNNMDVRAHCLWWDYICSERLKTEIVGDTETLRKGTMTYVYNKYNNGEITLQEAETMTKEIQTRFENIVLEQIEQEFSTLEGVTEWDLVNEILSKQYFKIYLYDRKYLTDNSFIVEDFSDSIIGRPTIYEDNDEYYQFLANCFSKARELNSKAKLVYNDNIIKGKVDGDSLKNDIRVINQIKKNTNNIDAIGVQYHVSNRYYYSPQNYYNNINNVLQQTGIEEAIITEYDNYLSEKIDNYSKDEKKNKADYLRDSLIMAYSNPNIYGFNMWVYNSKRFEDEERQAYEELVTPWLNYKEMGVGDSNGYSTRLYNGEYTAEVTLPNGKKQTFNFKVGNDLTNSIEIVVWTKLTGIDIDTLPNNLNVYRSENLDLSGGYINAYFDDNTVEKIAMNDPKVLITGYDKNKLGKQTITLTYEGKQVSFDINVLENVANIAAKMKEENLKIKNQNISIYNNENVNKKYAELIKLIDNMVANSATNNLTRIEKIYRCQIDLLDTIISEYKNGKFDISNEQLRDLIISFINIKECYRLSYSYYVLNDDIETIGTTQNALNDLIDKYNAYSDIGIVFLKDVINLEKNIYNSYIQTDSISDNYLNKQSIIKVSGIITKVIDYKLETFRKEEKSKLKITADTNMSEITNKDVTITLEHGEYTNIINNGGKDIYTFTENSSFIFKVEIKGEIYALFVKVDNIDKSKVDINDESSYEIDNDYIINIEKNTKIKTLEENLIISGEHKLLRNGEEVSNKSLNVATGDVIVVGNRNYILVVTGDVNFDGDCDIKDLIMIRKYLLGEEKLNNLQKKAADIKKDKIVDLKDLLEFRKEVIK